MALPSNLQRQFSPEEIEFIAGNDIISIIPNFTMEKMDFIQASYGPFIPPLQSQVPLWLALALKKNRKCTIVPPDWLNKEHLQDVLQQEEAHDAIQKVPFHYMEVAHMLLEFAPEEIPDLEQVRKLLKDVRECRQSKTRALLEGLEDIDREKAIKLHNLSRMEINELRPIFTEAFNEITKLPEVGQREEETMEA
ncbi:DNA replication protein psf2 [Umbelopsis sp. WA50703]